MISCGTCACLFKAQEENFLQFVALRNIDEVEEASSFGFETNVVPKNMVRRVAIYANRDVGDLLPFIDNRDGSLRSLAVINQGVGHTIRASKPLFSRF